MTRWADRHPAGKLRLRMGWKRWGFAIAGVLVLACAETSFRPQKSKPDARPDGSPASAAGIQNAQLSLIPASGSRVELQGEATIGAWKSQSSEVHGKVVLDVDATALNALFDRIESSDSNDDNRVHPYRPTLAVRSPPIADISVPIMSLHGSSGGMDRDMQNALKVSQYPSIEYVFQQVEQATLEWGAPNRHARLKLRVIGTLHMAGVGRPITMDVIVERDSRRHFLARAQTALLMTDFGVTPPGALFGLIKADDRVVVVFDLDLAVIDHSGIH